MNKKKIVVCGATGNQGRAVAKTLMQTNNWEVIALTRKPQSAAAFKLKALGARIVLADTQSKQSLLEAFDGAFAVFGVTQPWSADYKKCDVTNELLQGSNIIEACKAKGVAHLVFTSIINMEERPTGVSHVDSKLQMEQQLKESGVPYTILRCAQFMDNIGMDFFPVKNGKVKGFVSRDARVPYVSCKDIGAATARVLESPALYANQTFDLIGDLISGDDLAATVAGIRGERYKYSAAPAFLLRLFAPEFYTMRRWFERSGRAPHLAPLLKAAERSKQVFPTLTVKEHLLASNWFR